MHKKKSDMRTLSYTLIFSLMLFMSYMSSCSRDFQLISAENGVSRQAVENLGGELLNGKVSINTSDDGSVTIVVNDINYVVAQLKNKQAGMGNISSTKEAFVLQGVANNSNQTIDLKMVNAEVVKLPGFLLVNIPSKASKYVFRINGEEPENFQSKLASSGSGITGVYEGYGLSYRTGITEKTAPAYYKNKVQKQILALSPLNVDGGGGGGVSCSSGGVGSTSCSSTNNETTCSVSCATGYYACCSGGGTSCTCVKNPPPD